jgi:hypothetical protein
MKKSMKIVQFVFVGLYVSTFLASAHLDGHISFKSKEEIVFSGVMLSEQCRGT